MYKKKLVKIEYAMPGEVFVCVHISGAEYDSYIRLCNTRSLGGISQEFHARVVRQLFPYKPLRELGEGRTKNPKLLLTGQAPGPATVPAWGNNSTSEKHFTASEKRQLDQVLLAWARWRVDWPNGFVESSDCERRTTNSDKICDRCRSIMKDPSFQRAMRRVRSRPSI